jgi:Helix-turn-helix domain
MTERLIILATDWRAAVRERMAERGLKHDQVEHDAEIGAGYLSVILSGKKEPRLPTLERLLCVVGLSLALVAAPAEETPHEPR